jgi:hypothetical protein
MAWAGEDPDSSVGGFYPATGRAAFFTSCGIIPD